MFSITEKEEIEGTPRARAAYIPLTGGMGM